MIKFITMVFMVLTIQGYAQSTLPVLSNFRIESTQPGRVYFDSNTGLTGSTVTGFFISGKKVSGISLKSGSTTGHYLTVSIPFTFWDNNTIRYDGGSNLKSSHGISISVFTLQYIMNKIPEPKGTGKVYYVSTSGSDSRTGLSQSNAWRSITYAAKMAEAGDIVYIKAGNYGAEKIVATNNGTTLQPIKFIGYKSIPGDTPKLLRSQSTNFSANEMPLIQSTSTAGSGFKTNGNYIILRNFQSIGYESSIDFGTSNYSILDNIYASGGYKYDIDGFNHNSIQNRVINSYASNSRACGIRMAGSRHLVENLYVSSFGKPDMDYYISIYGGISGLGEHIVRNCAVVRDPSDTHPGHGISLKASGNSIEYSLVEKSTVTDVGMALEARHSKIKNNVYKDILITKKSQLSQSLTGIQITSAQKNIFERIHVNGNTFGIKFLGSTEDIYALDAGNSNIIRNCLFTNNNINLNILEDLNGKNRVPKNNSIVNCTFNNSNSMYSIEANESGSGNTITNSIIGNVKSEYGTSKYPHNFQYAYTNFFSDIANQWSSKAQSGLGNLAVNPKFENITSGNFRLRSDSPVIDKGKLISGIKFDFDKKARFAGKSMDVGAFEHQATSTQNKITQNMIASAGEDQTVCKGERVTLRAVGGTSYLWNTGAKRDSIIVSPSVTTVYSVMIMDGENQLTDEVVVSVINCEEEGHDTGSDLKNVMIWEANHIHNSDLDNDHERFSVSVYPNPTQGVINIQSKVPLDNFNLVVMTINGHTLYSRRIKGRNGLEPFVDLSGFPKGVYLVRLYNADENYIKKIMVI